jgi:hypothetical protein
VEGKLAVMILVVVVVVAVIDAAEIVRVVLEVAGEVVRLRTRDELARDGALRGEGGVCEPDEERVSCLMSQLRGDRVGEGGISQAPFLQTARSEQGCRSRPLG